MIDLIGSFFSATPKDCGSILNERALQLELACFFRSKGLGVQFEKRIYVPRPQGSTAKPKINLDLLVTGINERCAIELKVPLNGQHPETLYSFCMDIEFVEAIVHAGEAETGLCLMLTNDQAFWKDSGRGSEIHNFFRVPGSTLTGRVRKPTGAKDSVVVVSGEYIPQERWREVEHRTLLPDARYLALTILG